MLAIIKELKKFPTQPTNKETVWVLEFVSKPKNTESLMGWICSNDTMQQVKLTFENFKQAVKYAKDNDIEYSLQSLGGGGNVSKSMKTYLDVYQKN